MQASSINRDLRSFINYDLQSFITARPTVLGCGPCWLRRPPHMQTDGRIAMDVVRRGLAGERYRAANAARCSPGATVAMAIWTGSS